jgi:hypothetical protein
MPEEVNVKHFYHRQDPLVSITLSKGQKGGYAWDVKVEGAEADTLITQLQEIDQKLKQTFGVNQEKE